MGHDVFISHSTKDKPAANVACAALEASGVRCWIAPRDILPGQSWAGSIVDAIGESRVMLLLFSTGANESGQVKREVERAGSRGVPIVPVRVEDVRPSKELEYFISTPHWLDAFAPPFEQHLDLLVRAVRGLMDTAVPAGGADSPAEASKLHAPPPKESATLAVRFNARSIGCALSLALCLVIAVGLWIGVVTRTPRYATMGPPDATARTNPRSTPPVEDDIDSLPITAPDVGTITQRTTTGARTTSAKFGLYLFAPGAAGATVKEHPTFYWYLPQSSDEDTEAVVAEIGPRKTAGRVSQLSILMRKTYTGTQPPGIYAATLDEAALQPNKLYQVSVVMHRSADPSLGEVVNSTGYVTRVADTGADADNPAACAKAGLWYDAVDAAMRRIGKGPSVAAGHRQLHALLRAEHVFSTAALAGPADPAAVRAAAQQEKELFERLDSLREALIMSKPPEKGRHER